MEKELEVRLSLLDEEQLERLIWAEPEKWGIEKELIAMCDCWADVLEVEKVSDTEFTISFDLDTHSDVVNVSSVITFKYQFYEDDVIDDEFENSKSKSKKSKKSKYDDDDEDDYKSKKSKSKKSKSKKSKYDDDDEDDDEDIDDEDEEVVS